MEEIDNWEIATLINKIDAHPPSDYLNELILLEKEGKITTEEIIKKLKKYYGEKNE